MAASVFGLGPIGAGGSHEAVWAILGAQADVPQPLQGEGDGPFLHNTLIQLTGCSWEFTTAWELLA